MGSGACQVLGNQAKARRHRSTSTRPGGGCGRAGGCGRGGCGGRALGRRRWWLAVGALDSHSSPPTSPRSRSAARLRRPPPPLRCSLQPLPCRHSGCAEAAQGEGAVGWAAAAGQTAAAKTPTEAPHAAHSGPWDELTNNKGNSHRAGDSLPARAPGSPPRRRRRRRRRKEGSGLPGTRRFSRRRPRFEKPARLPRR